MAETNYGLLNLQEETGETRNNQIKSQSYIDTFVLSWDDVPFPQDVVAHYKKISWYRFVGTFVVVLGIGMYTLMTFLSNNLAIYTLKQKLVNSSKECGQTIPPSHYWLNKSVKEGLVTKYRLEADHNFKSCSVNSKGAILFKILNASFALIPRWHFNINSSNYVVTCDKRYLYLTSKHRELGNAQYVALSSDEGEWLKVGVISNDKYNPKPRFWPKGYSGETWTLHEYYVSKPDSSSRIKHLTEESAVSPHFFMWLDITLENRAKVKHVCLERSWIAMLGLMFSWCRIGISIIKSCTRKLCGNGKKLEVKDLIKTQ